ncbi:AsmA-like C-terminal region-containing protein [Aureimonas jatrophae]|uniref:Uncharacterized protein involved in outer membrane biogenesis n=1 Tax=Aureimonas jatrophae TaxID=1166073 RepID=A0A1H0GRX0_9HYPH|nr:AsmA-like C-terminal region-containing protein [Aureimonas jatrophae]MBB3949735.1 hypothetical protein [Aureimonas jatrophae]SDO09598.1 Uncharacterized protein involved in outer membrane biogenesis [Aureimonas jatrophae]
MKAFIALGSVIVVALVVLLVGPLFVDWTVYRSQFEEEASRLLGQKVEVRGKASARLLPFPSVTFDDVVIGDRADPILSIASFRMDAELAPYLSGEIRIFDMRLDAPRLTIPIEADGSVRWPVTDGASADGTSVVLESVAIAGGSIVLEDRRAGRRFAFTNVNAELAAQSLAGPFVGTATLNADDEPLTLNLSTGRVDAASGLPVRLTTISTRLDVSASVDAVFSNKPDRPIVDGKIRIATPATAEPDEAETTRFLPPGEATAAIQLTTHEASLTDVRIEVGNAAQPYVVEGNARLAIGAIPHFDLTVRGQATDFDRLAPSNGSSSPTFQQRLASLRGLIERLPTSDIPGRVQLSLPLLTVGDTTLRNLSFVGSPTADGWSVETFSAELPGRSQIEASGLAALRTDPSFKGSLLLAVRQPAAFFNWVGLASATELVSLSRAGLQADVEFSTDTQRLSGLEIDLDGGTLTGSVQRTMRPEGTVNLVDLKGGSVDLRPLAAVVRTLPNADTISSERFDVQFDAGPVTFASYRANHLAADFMLQNGLLEIADMTADDFAGASIHAEGTIADLFDAPKPDLGIDVHAEEPSGLLSLLADLAPDSPFFRTLQTRAGTIAPLTLAGTLASPTGEQTRDLLLALSGTAGGTATDLRLALENGLAAQSLDGRFGLDAMLENDNAAILLGQLGRPVVAIDGLSPLRISLSASGAPDHPIATSLVVEANDTKASLNGSITLDATGVTSVSAEVLARSEDVAPWLTTLGIAAGQGLERVPLDVAGRLTWSPHAWEMSAFKGAVADERVMATLAANGSAPVVGSLEVSALAADWLQRVALGLEQRTVDTAFGRSLMPKRAFSVDVAADRLTNGNETVGRDLQLLLSGDGSGLLQAQEVSVSTGTARATGEITLRNVDGLVNVEGNGALLQLELPNEGVLAGQMDVSGQLAGAGRNLSEIISSLNGSGMATLRNARIFGLSPDILTPVMLAADSQTAALDAATVAQLVSETGDGSSFSLGSRTLSFQIGAGTLRTDPFEANDDGADLQGDVAIRLSDGELSGQLTLRPKTSDVVPGSEPPRVDYRIAGTVATPDLEARTEALTSYVGIRAYQREQARVDALREDLSETARLRREARLYRERTTIRDERTQARQAAEAASRRQLVEEEEERRKAAQAAAQSIEPIPATPPGLPDLSGTVTPQGPSPPGSSNGLPGVRAFPSF